MIWLKRYWGILILLILVGGYISYSWMNSHADDLTVDCGLAYLVLDYEHEIDSSPPEVFYYSDIKQFSKIVDEMLMADKKNDLADLFRDIYDWGWFPPEKAQLIKDMVFKEYEIESVPNNLEELISSNQSSIK